MLIWKPLTKSAQEVQEIRGNRTVQFLLKKQSDWQSPDKQHYFTYKNSVESLCQQQKLKRVARVKSCCLSSDFKDACKSHSKSVTVQLGLDKMFIPRQV